jgi:hypothetical protein
MAADPSIDAESAGAAADNTDQNKQGAAALRRWSPHIDFQSAALITRIGKRGRYEKWEGEAVSGRKREKRA